MTDEEIMKDRAKSYGDAKVSFQGIANLWTNYIDYNIEPHEVAIMMALLKINRIKTAEGDSLKDSFQDARNYLTLAEGLKNGE